MAENQLPSEQDFLNILERLKSKDESLTDINLNNLENAKSEWAMQLMEQLIATASEGNLNGNKIAIQSLGCSSLGFENTFFDHLETDLQKPSNCSFG